MNEEKKKKRERLFQTGFIKYLTDEEFLKIKDYVENKIQSPPTKICLKVMMYLGIRVGEAITLKRSNFNDDFSKLTYIMLKTKSQKRG